jgi:lysozyme
MVDVIKDELMERIKEHEGYRLDPYFCTEGFLTGGYGHRIMDGEDVPTTKEGWDKVFEQDFNKAWSSMERLCEENELDIPLKAQGILCEILALQSHSYMDAASEMLDSKWARQTPNRAKDLSSRMEELAS